MARARLIVVCASVLAALLAVEPSRLVVLDTIAPPASAQQEPDDEDDEDDDDDEIDDGDIGAADEPDPGDPADDDAGGGDDGATGGDDDAAGGGDDDPAGDDGGTAGGDDDDGAAGGDGDDDGPGGDDGAAGGGNDDDGSAGGTGDDDDGSAGGANDDDADDDDAGERTDGGGNDDRGDRSDAERYVLATDESYDDEGYLVRRGEVIALSADPDFATRAGVLGLRVIAREPLPALGRALYRLRVPPRGSIDGLLARLRAQEPDGAFDYNHLYADATGERGEVRRSALQPARSRALGTGGAAIGLIDTQIDLEHAALRGARIEQRRFVPEARRLSTEHGTAVASLLVGELGLMPDGSLVAAAVFYATADREVRAEAADLAAAVAWMVERRVSVINMSLAGPPNDVLEATLNRAAARGHLVVAAVGNAGPAAPPAYPAAYAAVVAVTAVGEDLRVYRRANRGEHVALAAPGVGVEAAAPGGFARYTGTSFASPYVAALAASLLPEPDSATVVAVRTRLQAAALDLGAPGPDPIYGHGLARPPAVAPRRVAAR